MSEPREWKNVTKICGSDDEGLYEELQLPSAHVIEHSAYAAAIKERDDLLEKCRTYNINLLEAERDEARAELAQVYEGMSVDLRLGEQLAQARAELEEIKSYMTKVPTQSYEKRLVMDLTAERERAGKLEHALVNLVDTLSRHYIETPMLCRTAIYDLIKRDVEEARKVLAEYGAYPPVKYIECTCGTTQPGPGGWIHALNCPASTIKSGGEE